MTLPPVAAAAPSRRPPSRAWAAVGVLGEILITLGVVLLLFVVYQLWWTNVESGRAATQIATDLRAEWEQPTPDPDEPEPAPDPDASRAPEPGYVEPEFGSAFAFMYVPRLRSKVWGTPILHSVSLGDLARGIGHYPDSALPGQEGNFALAGHRATNGEPLRDIDQLQVGDRVYVETREEWLIYELTEDRIVSPRDTWVIDPVPGRPGATPTERLITITTCHPRWASYQRWIWWGEQVDRIDKSTGELPAAIAEVS